MTHTDPAPSADIAAVPLPAALWPLLLKAGLTLLQPKQPFGPVPRQFCHQTSAPSSAQLSAYQQFFGIPAGPVPLCFYYPLLQKAQLASMLQCPGLKVAGLIHLHNELQARKHQSETQLCGDGPLLICTVLSTVPHEKGLLLRAEQQLWQQQRLVLTGSSEYLLQKGVRSGHSHKTTQAPIRPEQRIAEIETAPEAPRAYARLSGDYNPIHLWRWSARLFGQPQPILHGMASAALLCQALPVPVQQLYLQFKTPVLPGIPLQLTQQNSGEYALWQQGRLCLLANLQLWPKEADVPDAG
ncbi:MaoC/PaaZ C-terminal domain-containing protein [Rheinheimera texasensis]|uniref:MaoC/PaaZ C-terminal domain-containing protein n=1 Tax=Rheinheimera texasensis TaxID=306205 RepID=UPI000A01A13E|nr:MaoC/PaaZ C-terminal domain-containing protein [Rheinheimera texasensis]